MNEKTDFNSSVVVVQPIDKGMVDMLNEQDGKLGKFAHDVLERFNNPFVDYAVASIMLNSFPKFQICDLPR